MERRQFTREFKLEAVKLVRDRACWVRVADSAATVGAGRNATHHASIVAVSVIFWNSHSSLTILAWGGRVT